MCVCSFFPWAVKISCSTPESLTIQVVAEALQSPSTQLQFWEGNMRHIFFTRIFLNLLNPSLPISGRV